MLLSPTPSLREGCMEKAVLVFCHCEWNGHLLVLRFSDIQEKTTGFLPSIWRPEILLDSRCGRLRADVFASGKVVRNEIL